MSKVNVLAFYLPQFHELPENNKWWGEGFTEWVNVKKARPLFEGHDQPRVPLGGDYYDLTDVNVMRRQAALAKENGLGGFCFYHYWFYERAFMDKPLLNYLNAADIDFPYCFCWANESWTNAWAKGESSVIMEQKYGDSGEWKKHFDFMLPFFRDTRYIRENGKPLLVIYRPYLFEGMSEMLDFWDALARENGLGGMTYASQRFEEPQNYRALFDRLDMHIEYQPGFARAALAEKKSASQVIRGKLHDAVYKAFNKDLSFHQKANGPVRFDYDTVWTKIITSAPSDPKAAAGAFVDWDNTPRHERRGSAFTGVTPEKFESYMRAQIKHIREQYSSNYLFLFAWNEWGEGGYIEPDESHGDAYLKAIKNALDGE